MSTLSKWIPMAILCALMLVSSSHAQDLARMDQVVRAKVEAGEFMGAVIVARGEEIVFSKAYGNANLEWRIDSTSKTKFRLASITKQFTAASILLLEERGKLSLRDPIKKFLPDAPAAWEKVTLTHLLSHTSGIVNFTNYPEYRKKQSATSLDEAISWFRDKPLEFAPGEKMAYSNSGYLLLGYVIEKTSGMKYGDFVRENIFIPLGMQDSSYDSNEMIIERRAEGYIRTDKEMVHAPFVHMSIPHAAGALLSTTEDLVRWNRGLYGEKLLSSPSVRKMTSPIKGDYALGLSIGTNHGRRVRQHGGGIDGFSTYLAYYPETKVTVAALANLDGAASQEIVTLLGALAHGDTVTLVSERNAIDVPLPILQRYLGTYALAPSVNLMITIENGQLMAQASGQNRFPVYAESHTRFFLRAADIQMEFGTSSSGEVTHVVMHEGGQKKKALRTNVQVNQRQEISLSVEALQRFVGIYALNPGFDLAIRLEGNHLTLQTPGQIPDTLYAESGNKFFSKTVDATIEFSADAAGNIVRGTLKQGAFTGEAHRK